MSEAPPARIPEDNRPSLLLPPASAFPQEAAAAVLDEANEIYHHLRRLHYVWAAVVIHAGERGHEFLPAWNAAAAKYRALFVELAARAG